MKVYKPLRLGYLSRVTVHAGRPRLSVALLSYFPFEAPRRIGLEQDMWQEIMPVLGNRILDPCDAKPRGEVLVVPAAVLLPDPLIGAVVEVEVLQLAKTPAAMGGGEQAADAGLIEQESTAAVRTHT